MDLNLAPVILFPTLLLIAASAFDLKTGRFPNWLFILSTVGSLGLLIYYKHSLVFVGLSFLSALFLFLVLTPLVFMGALGAGDLKLLFVLCLLTEPTTTLWVLAYSLFWGLFLGITKVILAGELLVFTQSLVLNTPQVRSQKIPYTVALLLGWMSLVSLGGVT